MDDVYWSRSDAMKLNRALFEMIPDALLLTDAQFCIVATNGTAVQRFADRGDSEEGVCLEGNQLLGTDWLLLLAESVRHSVRSALQELANDTVWRGSGEAVDASGSVFPVDICVHRVLMAGDAVWLVVLRDTSLHEEMREDLQRSEAAVEGMNLALRHVIRSVHEERRELKEELAQQVKDQVLPALERIVDEESPDVRQNYKSVIEDHLGELAEGSAVSFDGIMDRLTPREVEICRLIALGRKSKDICELLHVSFETMQTHRKNIRRKLGLKGHPMSLYVFLQQNPM
ncbi:helix-turn-helix domain-containing protein [Desulfovibrio psychrotolerans]|uniref:HTH luxR-type domain-containing protein n=1 Tax=Desulfovibrio psychrotolerans TaxID=415242 RepID=A0A7J0BQK8_9BACT|nr:helix-turn-helix transcriptional regulator [Desulfovibrio psychrotolerans]GFM35415.1 hypothetical protein DSM19430T_00990 [Desulfovibrio psychrotolerans]